MTTSDEDDLFVLALQDATARQRLMAGYAGRKKGFGWSAIANLCLALMTYSQDVTARFGLLMQAGAGMTFIAYRHAAGNRRRWTAAARRLSSGSDADTKLLLGTRPQDLLAQEVAGAVACLACGATIPSAVDKCSRCGWSYRDAAPSS